MSSKRETMRAVPDPFFAADGTSAYEIDAYSPRETWTEHGLEVEVQTAGTGLLWADRLAAVKAILGGAETTAIINSPMLLSAATNAPPCYAVSCDVRPLEGRTDKTITTFAQPKYAVLTIRFRTTGWLLDSRTNPFELLCGETLETATEFLTMSPKNLFWDAAYTDEPVSDEEAPGLILRNKTWVLTLPFIASFDTINPFASVFSFEGTVNEQSHYSPRYGYSFGAGTLLMGHPEVVASVSPWGIEQYAVTLTMAYNPYGWNKFRRGGYGPPQPMYSSVAPHTYEPYTPTDWTDWVPLG